MGAADASHRSPNRCWSGPRDQGAAACAVEGAEACRHGARPGAAVPISRPGGPARGASRRRCRCRASSRREPPDGGDGHRCDGRPRLRRARGRPHPGLGAASPAGWSQTTVRYASSWCRYWLRRSRGEGSVQRGGSAGSSGQGGVETWQVDAGGRGSRGVLRLRRAGAQPGEHARAGGWHRPRRVRPRAGRRPGTAPCAAGAWGRAGAGRPGPSRPSAGGRRRGSGRVRATRPLASWRQPSSSPEYQMPAVVDLHGLGLHRRTCSSPPSPAM